MPAMILQECVRMLFRCCWTLFLVFMSVGQAIAEVDFAKEIQPLLAKRCYACHGADEMEGGLSFTSQEAAFAEAESGERAIVPGDVDGSHLLARISSDDEGDRMPPEGDPLSKEEIDLFSRWIQEGAAWSKHWAFEPMQRRDPPIVADANWNRHPIDAYIYEAVTQGGLQPNGLATRATLIRRATFDLTGLPPTADEVQEFVNSNDPLAYEKLIDRLLASPHYGERWGRHWLDLVRFAETNSFERDGAKPNAWKYRDYVIRSFNEDKPYDQFLREQLAGDELDHVTPETLTATGYYRLGIWDDEPADPLLARYDGLDDIITTTGQSMLGLTLNCARCHDHKVDPIPQTDYYSFVAFLEDVTRYGSRGNQTRDNQIDITNDGLKQQYAENDAERRELEKKIRDIEQIGIAKMSAPDQRATEGPKRDRNRVLKEKLQDHLLPEEWTQYQHLKDKLEQNRNQLKKLPRRESVLGLARYRKTDQPTRVLNRGNPSSPGEEVSASLFLVSSVNLLRKYLASTMNRRPAGRRRILADWIASKRNRLTARVIANRVWQFHFGRGIVRSSNNFGQLGTPPTHPELLDFLAYRLMDGGWKLKDFHKWIMTSRAYRMSSASHQQGLELDPNNDLFWRFDPRRLSAEEVRDSVLAVNKSLNRKVYGPSIYPSLSQEVLAGQSRPGSGWGKSSAEEQNRRSIYIFVKRSLLTPMMTAFDFPDPDLTCEGRFATLQPGQALALLNSQFIHDQGERLAKSISADELADAEVIQETIRTVLAREATAEEVNDGKLLIRNLQDKYKLSRERAVALYCVSVLNWNEFLFLD